MHGTLASETRLAGNGSFAEQVAKRAGAATSNDEMVSVAPSYAIAFTLISSNSPLTKTFRIGAAGIEKTGKTMLYRGAALRTVLQGTPDAIMRELAGQLVGLNAYQALICAPPPSGRDEWPVVSKDELSSQDGAIARTKEFFRPMAGAALLALDFDTADFPPDLLEKIRRVGSISEVLASVHPGFREAATVTRNSASSAVVFKGQAKPAENGQHRFYLLSDGLRVDEFVRRLADRLMLEGFLWGRITAAGTVLPRTLFDIDASCDPGRLVYEADPIVADEKLELAPGNRAPRLSGNMLLDVDGIHPLTQEEKALLDRKIDQLHIDLAPQAALKRDDWRNARIADLTRRGVDPERAARTVSGDVEKHEVSSDFLVLLDDGSAISVREILADLTRYHKQTCADPFEWDYGGGANKAIIFCDCSPCRIESQAHGGIRYYLIPAVEDFFDDLGDLPVSENTQVWPEPVDLFGDSDPGELATPPAGSLPGILERWGKSEARRKGVSEAFAAAAAVTVIASAIGNSLRIYPRLNDDWATPAGFWCTLVAPPGSGKSPLIAEAVRPLKKLSKECWQQDRKGVEAWEQRSRARKKDLVPEPRPRERRYVVDDITLEKQARVHADNPRGLLRAPDEFVGLLSSLGAYKKNADGDRSQTLRLYDGDDLMIDRVGGGTIHVDSALMSILAGSQPDKIRTLVRDLGSDGFLQRVNFIMDDGVKRQGIDEVPDRAALAHYENLIRELATRHYGAVKPFRMTPPAAAVFDLAKQQINALAYLPGASAAWAGHVGKWEKILARLVLVFHCVEQWEMLEFVTPEVPVEAGTVEKAVLFGRFLLRHSLHFYETFFGSSAEASEARWIAGYILTRPDALKLTRRGIGDAKKSLRGEPRMLLAAMRELESFGWVKVSKRDEHGPAHWDVNPSVHARFSKRAEWECRDREQKRSRIQEAGAARKNWLNSDRMSDGGD